MTTIEIACAADDRYVPHLAAMLHSLRWHERSAAFRVHYLCGSQPSPNLRRALAAMAAGLSMELRWVAVEAAAVEALPRQGYLSREVWYRIFMPQLMPDLDRVLYIDADVIATDSVAALWGTPLEDALLGAVTNVVPGGYRHRAAELGLPGPADYFNLGVALWNLDAMRRERFTEAVLAYAERESGRLLWLEQDAINALFWRRRLPLHPRWNCQNGIFFGSWGNELLDPRERAEALQDPGLLHFEGGSFGKPWHYLSNHPRRTDYFFHRERTPWPRVAIEGRSVRNVLRKHAPATVLDLWRRLKSR